MNRVTCLSGAALLLLAGGEPAAGTSPTGRMGQAMPQSPRPGGYGPVRLGMTEADAVRALNTVARDVLSLPTSAENPLDDIADRRLDRMAVMTPWEDVYVGRLDASTRIQLGAHAGRVVTVMLRTRLTAGDPACRSAFAALVARNAAEFGRVPVAEQPGNAGMANGRVDFAGWKLRLERIQTGTTCNLIADYTSDASSAIEADWRARLP